FARTVRERIGSEAVFRQIRTFVVADRNAGSANANLSGNTYRRRSITVENVDSRVVYRPANADGFVAAIDAACSRPDRRLGRTIEIPKFSNPIKQPPRKWGGKCLPPPKTPKRFSPLPPAVT